MIALALILGIGSNIAPVYAKTSHLAATKKTKDKYMKQAKKLGPLNKAQKNLTKRKKDLKNANQAYNNALVAYNTNVANAKANYDTASNAYEAAGYDFIMSNATANYYQDTKNEMATNTTLAAYLNGLDEAMKSTLSTSNLKNDIKLIRELNSYRATDSNFPNLKPLGIDYDLMIFASVSIQVSQNVMKHVYFEECLQNMALH